MKLRAFIVAALLIALPCRAQELTPLESIESGYRQSISLVGLFSFYAVNNPQYFRLVEYFQGRADAYSDSYFVLTGVRL